MENQTCMYGVRARFNLPILRYKHFPRMCTVLSRRTPTTSQELSEWMITSSRRMLLRELTPPVAALRNPACLGIQTAAQAPALLGQLLRRSTSIGYSLQPNDS